MKRYQKHYYAILDCETTADNRVADFGVSVHDRKGNCVSSLGVLISGIHSQSNYHWALGNSKLTEKKYDGMLADGYRALAAVSYINRWLAETVRTFDPVLTAYNIGFDWSKCRNTGIDLSIFSKRFDLMMAAKLVICSTPEYQAAAVRNNWFTAGGKISSKADHVARFIDPTLPPEPHTALEDARDYESIILHRIINDPKTRKQLIDAGMAKTPSTKWMLGI